MNRSVTAKQVKKVMPVFTPVRNALLQRKCACGKHTTDQHGECTECRKKRTGLQRQAVNQSGPETAPPIVHEVLRSAGRPLDPATRAFMEPRFNHDFSGVRIHTDERAAESARAVNALAYTVGNHVAFGAGQYAPGSGQGRQLLAHELAHVVQQGDGALGIQRQVSIAAEYTAEEAAAERIAARVVDETETTTEGSLEIDEMARTVMMRQNRLQRRCRKNPPDSRYPVDINLRIPATPAPNHRHNTAWISNQANDPSGNTAGLTRFQATLRYRISYGRPNAPRNTVGLTRFQAWYENPQIRIFLTNEFPARSCRYNDLLRHERQHDTDYRANTADSEESICDSATTWPESGLAALQTTQAELQFLIDEWMAFENWQHQYDNWWDGCVWDTIDYPRMYQNCPGVQVVNPVANCGNSPPRPVQQGLPQPQKNP